MGYLAGGAQDAAICFAVVNLSYKELEEIVLFQEF